MANGVPPSGRWDGYYLYGHGGLRHRMKLTLVFEENGAIDGDGTDDIAPFVITGRFDMATSAASWAKEYVGLHTVEYSGLYCRRAICGDWTLMGHSGGFWIWPESEKGWERVADDLKIEEPVAKQVDKFLDSGAPAEVDRVRIVYGHGMGVLRNAARGLR